MAISATNSFGTRDKLNVGAQSFDIYRLEHLERQSSESMARLPYSLRILLENLLRNEDARFVHKEVIQALANWTPKAAEKEIAYMSVFLRPRRTAPAKKVQPRSDGQPQRHRNPLWTRKMSGEHRHYLHRDQQKRHQGSECCNPSRNRTLVHH